MLGCSDVRVQLCSEVRFYRRSFKSIGHWLFIRWRWLGISRPLWFQFGRPLCFHFGRPHCFRIGWLHCSQIGRFRWGWYFTNCYWFESWICISCFKSNRWDRAITISAQCTNGTAFAASWIATAKITSLTSAADTIAADIAVIDAKAPNGTASLCSYSIFTCIVAIESNTFAWTACSSAFLRDDNRQGEISASERNKNQEEKRKLKGHLLGSEKDTVENIWQNNIGIQQ